MAPSLLYSTFSLYSKFIGKSLATVSFVTILTVDFAGENHSIAAMPDFEKRRGPAKKST